MLSKLTSNSMTVQADLESGNIKHDMMRRTNAIFRTVQDLREDLPPSTIYIDTKNPSTRPTNVGVDTTSASLLTVRRQKSNGPVLTTSSSI